MRQRGIYDDRSSEIDVLTGAISSDIKELGEVLDGLHVCLLSCGGGSDSPPTATGSWS